MRRVHSSAVILAFVGVLLLMVRRCSATIKIDENAFVVNETSRPLRILSVFGHAGLSHFNVFSPLVEELARRGHHVTVLSHFPRSESAKAKEPLPTYRDISLRDSTIGTFKNVIDLKRNFNMLSILIMLRNMADVACESALLHNTAVRQLIDSNERFDVMLTEGFNTNCFLGFVHRFDVPYLYMSSHQIMPWFNDELDNPDNPSFVMTLFQGYEQPMNLVSRTSNAMLSLVCKMLYEWYYRPRDQAIADKAFGPDLPNLKTLGQRSQALLVNTHASLYGNIPRLSNVVQIGGLHISSKLNGSLPRDIAEFLDNAPEGVLYFSLGSMIKLTTMPPDKMDIILNVIGSIPRKVLWKWESEQLPRQMNNVMAKKWFPQFDVLKHPNVKGFFGHGGLLGLSEAVYTGTPMVLLPMYGDQFHNAYTAKARGVAQVIVFADLDEQSLRQAINEIFNDTSYFENAQKLSKAYRDRPASPLETAVWWTEYIARGNGRPYMRSQSMDLSWYQRYLLDVILVSVVILGAFVYIVFRLLMLSIRVARGKSFGGKRKGD